jgi:hypothetical protein
VEISAEYLIVYVHLLHDSEGDMKIYSPQKYCIPQWQPKPHVAWLKSDYRGKFFPKGTSEEQQGKGRWVIIMHFVVN